jgi:hypothetical protein
MILWPFLQYFRSIYSQWCLRCAAGLSMQAVICQSPPTARPAPSKAAPAQTGPLVRPHGFSQARRTVPYAFNPALNSFGDGMGVPVASFVRPDCPPDVDVASQTPRKKEKRGKASSTQASRPQFRSALEQVCAPIRHSCCVPSPQRQTFHLVMLTVVCNASS